MPILNSLQVGGSGKSVTLSFAVPPEVLDMLSGFANQHGPRPSRPDVRVAGVETGAVRDERREVNWSDR